jgi:enhancing lycopene biosynthesis protein 2
MAKRIGLLLTGCGVKDGSEIHEATLSLLALNKLGAEIFYLAVNKDFDAIDHSKGTPSGERRNTLIESARISRGDITDIANVSADDMDGLVMPGGFGSATHISDFAAKGADCTVHPDVQRLIGGLHQAGKPIGAICIAPGSLAAALKEINVTGVKMTIGNDPGTAALINELGQVHVDCTVGKCVIDKKHKIVTTPAYMLGPGIKDIQPGIEAAVKAVYDMA